MKCRLSRQIVISYRFTEIFTETFLQTEEYFDSFGGNYFTKLFQDKKSWVKVDKISNTGKICEKSSHFDNFVKDINYEATI